MPLLEEYCYEDYTALAHILSDSLVDEQHQRIRHDLFASERRDDLREALLAPAPNLMASAQVVVAVGETEELAAEEEEE